MNPSSSSDPSSFLASTQVLTDVRSLLQHSYSLLLYQAVLIRPPGKAFIQLLHSLEVASQSTAPSDAFACLKTYGQWFQALAQQQLSWQAHLIQEILLADNPFTQEAQHLDLSQIPAALVTAARHDLACLQTLFACQGDQVNNWVRAIAPLETPPIVWEWPNLIEGEWVAQFYQCQSWPELLPALSAHYRHQGTGIFASYRAFRWQQEKLLGIAHPDPVCLEELVGYDQQRDRLVQNTQFLLAGYPALHVLLYGSRGSGKSSLVKAILNQFYRQGLRLVEVAKADLMALPAIVESLRTSPQKFITFVDDLSFEEDDDAFKALKVALEGSVTARASNVVVYATSNRRHLVREYFDDRPRPSASEEVHAWDTVQEKLSFSDRFGLTLTFDPANQPTYLAIVHHLANRAGVSLPPQELEFQALQWATRHNGRSGRTARQFIDFLSAGLAVSKHKAEA